MINSKKYTLMKGGKNSKYENNETTSERFFGFMAGRIMKMIDWAAERNDKRMKKDTVYEAKDFPWLKDLQKNQAVILTELMPLLPQLENIPNFHNIDDRMKKVTKDTDWKIFNFFLFGAQFKDNCSKCPQTVKLLKKVPGLQTALFSILKPDTIIAPHRGELKGTIRIHIPLIIPEYGSCALKIDDHVFEWSKTDVVIFDHTAKHAAWNKSDSIRIVLLFDVTKHFAFPWSLLNKIALPIMTKTRYIKEAISRTERSNLPEDTKPIEVFL